MVLVFLNNVYLQYKDIISAKKTIHLFKSKYQIKDEAAFQIFNLRLLR